MDDIKHEREACPSAAAPSAPTSAPSAPTSASAGATECQDAGQVFAAPQQVIDVTEEVRRLTISVGKSWRYHLKRRQHLDTMEFVRKTLSVFSGSAAAFSAFSQLPSWLTGALALFMAAISAADLVLPFSARSRLHEALCRRYVELLATIHGTVDPSARDVAKFKSERFKIEADSPPALTVLDDCCLNDEILSRGGRHHVKLTKWQMRFRNWIDLPPHERSLSERE
ncbi:hypothetical protein J2852_005500 [Azospirillum soli]|nr:hypothetical protein [Azospirillum soli]